eukprot:6480294-Amphidinium_carterae.1
MAVLSARAYLHVRLHRGLMYMDTGTLVTRVTVHKCHAYKHPRQLSVSQLLNFNQATHLCFMPTCSHTEPILQSCVNFSWRHWRQHDRLSQRQKLQQAPTHVTST